MLSSWKYQSIPSDSKEEQALPQESEKSTQNVPSVWHTSLPWIGSTIFFAFLALSLWLKPESGLFRTDFQAVGPWVEYEEQTFTGALNYDPVKKQPYREIDPSMPQYVGKPGPETDQLWEDLLRNEFTTMSEEEAAPFKPGFKAFPPDGKYHFELGVFHSLHCVNAVRKKLYEYVYQEPREDKEPLTTDPNDWEHIHIDHCLDHLRQAIMCHGDLSPAPLMWWDGYGIAFAVGQTRTCRKWDLIREWVDRRNLGLDETRS